MKKGVGSFLLVLCLSVTVPGHAAGGWTLYDDFSSGIINPDKWFGTEGGKTGRETKRIIVSEKLNLSERCYGGTDSNDGGSYSEQTLRITNPSNIRGFRAVVKPVKFEAVGCDNNTTYTAWVFARLIGRFFNTDPQSPDSSANDVYAYLVIERDSLSADPEDTARISAKVRRCIDDNCTHYNTLFWKDLGSIEAGQSATLSLEWDKANHKFVFKRDKSTVVYAYDTKQYPDTFPPMFVSRALSVVSGVPNCTSGPRPTGFMNASFDKVYIKTFSP